MQLTRQLGTLFVALLFAPAARCNSIVDTLLSKDPVAEAKRAFFAGDKKYIVVPICEANGQGETLPGWPLTDSPKTHAAIANGRRPITCGDLAEKAPSTNFVRVAKYAEKYNQTLLDLENASTTKTAGLANVPVDCKQLELQAIKLGEKKKLLESAQLYDRVIAECPARPDTMTSRGVLYAVMGEKTKAEAIINEAIHLAERAGDQCRADMSRAELATISGGPRLDKLPISCKPIAH